MVGNDRWPTEGDHMKLEREIIKVGLYWLLGQTRIEMGIVFYVGPPPPPVMYTPVHCTAYTDEYVTVPRVY
jgi:hypothetical protein